MKPIRLTRVDMLAFAAIVGAGAAAHFLGFEPVRRARADGMAQNALLSDRSAELAAKEQAIADRNAEKARLQAKLEASVQLQSSSTLNQRMAAIPEVGTPRGIRVREVVPKPPQPGKRLTKVPITIGGEGPSSHMAFFLADLHAIFPDMEVLSLAISARPEAPLEPARFSMELVWYTRAGSEGSASPRQEKAQPSP